MSAPIGSDLQIGFGFESADNLPQGYNAVSGITKFIRVKSLDGYYADRPLVSVENMDPSGQDLGGSNEQAVISPKFSCQPEVETLAWLLTHHCSYHGTIANPEAGVYVWPIRPFERGDTFAGSGGVTYVDSLAMETDMGDDKPNLVTGVRSNDISFKIAENKLTQMDVAMAGCYETYSDDVAEVAVAAAFTGLVLVRGHRKDPSAVTEIKFKVSSVAGSGFVGKVKFTVGVVAYGSTEHAVPAFGDWIDVILADETHAGNSAFDPLQVCFLDPDGDAALTVADEWTIAPTRVAATAAYPSKNVLGAAGAQFKIGGVVYPVHSLDIKAPRPRTASFAVGSKYAQTVQRNGRVGLSISLDRDALDRNFLLSLISGAPIAAVVDMYGDPIAGAYSERCLLNVPSMQVKSSNRGISNPNTLPEKIELVAGRVGAVPIYDFSITCGSSTLANEDMT